MNEFFEFLFCPTHGLLRPANWPMAFLFISCTKKYFNSAYQEVRENGWMAGFQILVKAVR